MNAAARLSLPRPRRLNALTQLADETGAIAVEYGLIAALVSLAILGTLVGVRDALIGLPLQSLIDALLGAVS